MKNFIESRKIARRAHSHGLSSSIFITVMLALSLIIPQNVVAQTQTPAIEVPTWAPYIMIGPNDLNNDSFNNHILTFGRGKTGENCGLWYISGSWLKAFNIGRTFNQQITHPSSYTGGRHMFFVDSNMHIGIEYWPGQNSQSHKLDVNGKIRVEDCFHWSDRRYKREAEPISNLDNLFKINAVHYKPSGEAFAEQLEILKKSGTLSESDLAIAEASTKATIEARNADNTIHYGFIAQELREVYPNLVSEDQHGFLSVNYTELIPVLVDAIKELNSKIEILENKNKELPRNTLQDVTTGAVLYQNNPNPFDTQTEIKYYIPAVAVNATICVYDMVGAEVLKLEIRGRESGSIVIDANSRRLLHAQPLFASAVVDNITEIDGKEVDVKRMILTGK